MKRQFTIKEALLATGVVALGLGVACCDTPWPFATAINGLVAGFCIGKTVGRKLGVRSAYWRTPLTCGEWFVVVLVVFAINWLIFTPAVIYSH